MKKILSLILVGAMAMSFVACNEKGSAAGGPLADSVSMSIGELMGSNFNQQLSMDSTIDMNDVIAGVQAVLAADTTKHGYLAGLQIGQQILNMFMGMKQQTGVEVNQSKFMAAFKQALMADSAMSQQEMMEKNMALESMMKRATAEAKEKDPVAQKNKKDGADFLASKVKEGYKKTPSGMAYKVLNEGAGENFTDNDVVMVKYVGKHINGEEFDSSKDEPVAFHLNQVVKGFAEMIKLMKPGMKVEVIIPGDLAYGPEGREPTIGSNETLVFEMETVGKQQPTAPAGK